MKLAEEAKRSGHHDDEAEDGGARVQTLHLQHIIVLESLTILGERRRPCKRAPTTPPGSPRGSYLASFAQSPQQTANHDAGRVGPPLSCKLSDHVSGLHRPTRSKRESSIDDVGSGLMGHCAAAAFAESWRRLWVTLTTPFSMKNENS